jgi:hypothetical protein
MSSSAACSICTPTEWHRVGAMGIAVRDAAKSVYEGRAQGPHITLTRMAVRRHRCVLTCSSNPQTHSELLDRGNMCACPRFGRSPGRTASGRAGLES